MVFFILFIKKIQCDGVAYFSRKSTLKNILLDYVIPNITKAKGETISLLLKEFKEYIDNNKYKQNDYMYSYSLWYTLNGKKKEAEIEAIYEDKVKEIERMAILFSEYKKQMYKKSIKKQTPTPIYESIKNGEVRFSILFKDLAKEGILPDNYDYLKVREYLVGLKEKGRILRSMEQV